MAADWLDELQHAQPKPPNYAEKTLAAYALGMKAGGPIMGVVIEPGRDCCAAARALPEGQLYDPARAPRLPLPQCERGGRCQCIYRPVMSYQRNQDGPEAQPEN
jgi:hypothetical protein